MLTVTLAYTEREWALRDYKDPVNSEKQELTCRPPSPPPVRLIITELLSDKGREEVKSAEHCGSTVNSSGFSHFLQNPIGQVGGDSCSCSLLHHATSNKKLWWDNIQDLRKPQSDRSHEWMTKKEQAVDSCCPTFWEDAKRVPSPPTADMTHSHLLIPALASSHS